MLNLEEQWLVNWFWGLQVRTAAGEEEEGEVGIGKLGWRGERGRGEGPEKPCSLG